MSQHLILYGKSMHTMDQDGLQLLAEKLPDCEIVLMEDATIGAVSNEITVSSQAIYCLVEDLEARGLEQSQLASYVKPITYDDLTDLIAAAQKIISLL